MMTHRQVFLGALLATLTAISARPIWAEQATIWIGTGTSSRDEAAGIYRATLDLESGEISAAERAAKIGSPGFLALHPNGRVLYSVCDLPDSRGPGVAAYAIDRGEDPYQDRGEGPRLRLLNTQPIGDGGAAHLAADPTGRCLFTAQYGGGSVAVFPLGEDGTIKPRSALVEHEGSGPNRSRQEGPHPHWVGVDPTNQFLMVPDLGIDQVVVYRTDLNAGEIERHGAGECPPGAGPRHMKFSPDGMFAYVGNELDLSITVFRYDDGSLEPIQTITTLPEELREVDNTVSEVRIHPTGKFLYAANRGHDSIAVFQVDQATGKLTFVELEPIRGSWPRNFNLDPTGRWLVAAGANSNTLSVFELDQETGGLVFAGRTVNCPKPICVEFQEIE